MSTADPVPSPVPAGTERRRVRVHLAVHDRAVPGPKCHPEWEWSVPLASYPPQVTCPDCLAAIGLPAAVVSSSPATPPETFDGFVQCGCEAFELDPASPDPSDPWCRCEHGEGQHDGHCQGVVQPSPSSPNGHPEGDGWCGWPEDHDSHMEGGGPCAGVEPAPSPATPPRMGCTSGPLSDALASPATPAACIHTAWCFNGSHSPHCPASPATPPETGKKFTGNPCGGHRETPQSRRSGLR